MVIQFRLRSAEAMSLKASSRTAGFAGVMVLAGSESYHLLLCIGLHLFGWLPWLVRQAQNIGNKIHMVL